MPVGDTAIMNKPLDDPEPPLVGIIAVDAEDGSPIEILWRNGEYSVDIPPTSTRKLFPAPGDFSKWVGAWVQVRGYPAFGESPGSPKSGAASGVVLEAYGEGAYDAPAPEADQFLLVIATENGNSMFFVEVEEDPGDDENPVFIQRSRRAV